MADDVLEVGLLLVAGHGAGAVPGPQTHRLFDPVETETDGGVSVGRDGLYRVVRDVHLASRPCRCRGISALVTPYSVLCRHPAEWMCWSVQC